MRGQHLTELDRGLMGGQQLDRVRQGAKGEVNNFMELDRGLMGVQQLDRVRQGVNEGSTLDRVRQGVNGGSTT